MFHSQFVKIFSTFPDSSNLDDNLETRINRVLKENPRAKIVQAFPCPVEKIGGTDMHVMIVFERESN